MTPPSSMQVARLWCYISVISYPGFNLSTDTTVTVSTPSWDDVIFFLLYFYFPSSFCTGSISASLNAGLAACLHPQVAHVPAKEVAFCSFPPLTHLLGLSLAWEGLPRHMLLRAFLGVSNLGCSMLLHLAGARQKYERLPKHKAVGEMCLSFSSRATSLQKPPSSSTSGWNMGCCHLCSPSAHIPYKATCPSFL